MLTILNLQLDTPVGPVPVVDTALTLRDRLGGARVRWNIRRNDYRVEPGLYAIGAPDAESPVLVTANYKLTFDALRRELGGLDAWVLVVDSNGVNVWCAAGKGVFGTMLVSQAVHSSRLAEVVSHRTLILPQLAASGVAAHDVKAFTGFRVVYGPIRAADIPAFLKAGMKATKEMRAVTFTLRERVTLAPVELSIAWRPRTLAVLLAVALLGGVGSWGFSLAAVAQRGGATVALAFAGLVAGAVVMPALLPWLPGRMLSVKGALAGLLCGLAALIGMASLGVRSGMFGGAALLLGSMAIASYAAMNYTGTTPYTSLSGVLYEMRRALPFQIGAAVIAVLLWVFSAFAGWSIT